VKRSPKLLLLVAGLFALTVSSAWAWFYVAPPAPGERLRIRSEKEVVGHTYRPEPLVEKVLDTLSLDPEHVINGAYTAAAGPEHVYSVFLASWLARSAREMTVVQHTPDICWRAAGALPAALGQPPVTLIRIDGHDLAFECRVFAVGDSVYELTLWCTLVSGQMYGETLRFQPATAGVGASPEETRRAVFAAGRQLGGSQFLDSVRKRRPGTGDKQFVRLSTRVIGTDWREAHSRLTGFVKKWLHVEVDAAGR